MSISSVYFFIASFYIALSASPFYEGIENNLYILNDPVRLKTKIPHKEPSFIK